MPSPTIIQSAFARDNTTSISVTLGSTPIQGNILVLLVTGADTSMPTAALFTNYFNNLGSAYSNRYITAFYHYVTSADLLGAFVTFNVTNVSGWQNVALFEIDSGNAMFAVTNGLCSGAGTSTITTGSLVLPLEPISLRFVITEWDNESTATTPAGWTLVSPTGWQGTTTGTNNAAIWQVPTSLTGTTAISMSGATTDPIYADIQIASLLTTIVSATQVATDVWAVPAQTPISVTQLGSEVWGYHSVAHLSQLGSEIWINSVIYASLIGQFHQLTASAQYSTTTYATIIGQLNPLTGLQVGELRALTATITINVNNGLVIAANLHALTAVISTEAKNLITITGQIQQLTAALNINPRSIFAVNIPLNQITGTVNIVQQIGLLKARPINIFARKLFIQNPASLEPQFTQVSINGTNLLLVGGVVETIYNDPSVNSILQGQLSQSYLGPVQDGTVFSGSSAVTIVAIAASIALSDPTITIQILPSVASLPPGLVFTNTANGVATISGVVAGVPITATKYEILIRATNSLNVSVDRYFYFSVIPPIQQLYWSGPYGLGNIVRGDSVNIALPITNTLGLPLTYIVNPGLPPNLQIGNNSIVGVVSADIALQAYHFIITATDGTNIAISQQFSMTIISGTSSISVASNSILWQTTTAYLGSTYSTMPSYFGVNATNPSNLPIAYNLAPYSNMLPSTLSLDNVTGNIVGLTPFLLQNQTYNITIRASIESFYNDKAFSFTVLQQFGQQTVLSVSVPMEEPARMLNALGIWNTTIIKDSMVFRPENDSYFGRILQPQLVFGSRSFRLADPPTLEQLIQIAVDRYSLQPINIYDATTNMASTAYYSGLDVILGELQMTPVYSPEGIYAYDVIYATVVDFQNNTGGFVNGSEMPIYSTKVNPPMRVYPKSLNNMRQAYVAQSDGQDIENAGLPLWQRTTGWQLAIELCYIIAGQGQTALDALQVSGFAATLAGQRWTSGRIVFGEISVGSTSPQVYAIGPGYGKSLVTGRH